MAVALIEISGIDGLGKTTLLNNLHSHYTKITPCLCTAIFEDPIFTNELESVAKKQNLSSIAAFRVKQRNKPLQPYEYTEGFRILKGQFMSKISQMNTSIEIIDANMSSELVFNKAVKLIDGILTTNIKYGEHSV